MHTTVVHIVCTPDFGLSIAEEFPHADDLLSNGLDTIISRVSEARFGLDELFNVAQTTAG